MVALETRSAVVLLLSIGLFSAAHAADEVAPVQPAAATAAEATVPSLSAPGGRVPVVGGDTTTGAAQRATSASYELAGSGLGSASRPEEANILTATGKGKPLRFQNGIFVYPTVTVAAGYNDNVAGTSTNEKGSKIFVIRPEVVAELKRQGDRYTFSYVGNYGHYTSSSSDDFNHNEILLAGDNYFTSRARLGWGVGYYSRSDARGATDRVASDTPDRWRAPMVRLVGIYGAKGAPGRIELETGWLQKRYTNNRDVTRNYDVDVTTVSGRFFYRVLPRTSLVFEARNTWNEYIASTSTQDNSYRKLMMGATWELSAKTTGVLKMGRANKDYNLGIRRDPSASTWEASVVWTPMTYSRFDFETAQDIMDSSGVGNFTDTRSWTANWTHKWASYVSSNVNAGVVRADYDGIDRNDTTKNFGVGFFRELGYNFRAGLNWSRTKRDSNINTLDFKRNVYMLTLEAVL